MEVEIVLEVVFGAPSHVDCYNIDITTGYAECNSGYFIVGLERHDCGVTCDAKYCTFTNNGWSFTVKASCCK